MTERGQGLRVLAKEWSRGQLVPPHRHDEAQLLFARSGTMRITTAEGIFVVPPQLALLIPAGVEHAIRCATPVSLRTIYLDPRTPPGLVAHCRVVGVSPLLREVITRLVEDGVGTGPSRHLAALLTSELQAVPVAPLSLPEPEHPLLREIAAALRADPADPRRLGDWACLTGVSTRTLVRRFLAETGMSFRQWQRQVRLLAALERLAQGEPVTTVALDVGYASTSAFIATFRSALGTTPSRYFAGNR